MPTKVILLLDDSIDILSNLTEYLEMEGYKVLAANNGKKGIALAKEFIPNLIICDVLMPKMSGHEVLHLLLGLATTAEILFIFSTSLSEKIDKTESLQLGADDYIIKPFELESLLTMIKTCIKNGSKRHLR